MASIVFEGESSECDENSLENHFFASKLSRSQWHDFTPQAIPPKSTNNNVINNLFNRQIHGRFTKHSRAKTERLFTNVHHKCKVSLNQLIDDADFERFQHVYMGFTNCGNYFLSYNMKSTYVGNFFQYNNEYELYIWQYSPHERLKLLYKHKIFKHLKGMGVLDKTIFMQYPKDPYKLICYATDSLNPDVAHVTILTIPSKNCKHCLGTMHISEDNLNQGLCEKHGFIIHHMFTLSQSPVFEPRISLAFPDYFVINTGHHIHIIDCATSFKTMHWPNLVTDIDRDNKTSSSMFNDSMSELSESVSENLDSISMIESNSEDFSCEYDLVETSECNKPFHELNISCEPLNVTGKSYHNAVVQNIVDARFKRGNSLSKNTEDYLFSVPQTSSAPRNNLEKTKIIDKKIIDKTYEFIEETEKCVEKLSSFRKKRLAEKKYEFSEDNSENIIPFNSLRRERRFLNRSSQNRYSIRSPDFNSLFLSPRSPMQSPNSRASGQFSPYSSIRNSPHHSKSPISPKEGARRVYLYSPSIASSDCSDNDSRLIVRMNNSNNSLNNVLDRVNLNNLNNGLLIVAPRSGNAENKWLRKVVRRYTIGDSETSSLVSGQSRDDLNNPIEIPCMVHNLTDQQYEMVPEFKTYFKTSDTQLIVTQRSFDCEQFAYQRAQILCAEANLKFSYCQDYDIKMISVCPLSGYIICKAVIKIGAIPRPEAGFQKRDIYVAQFLFTWNILTEAVDIIECKDKKKLVAFMEFEDIPTINIPQMACHHEVNVLYCNNKKTKKSLRDINNYYEVAGLNNSDDDSYSEEDSTSEDSDD